MSEQGEVPNLQQTTRAILKPIQEKGVDVAIDQGKVAVISPEGLSITPDNKNFLTSYLNNILPELDGVSGSASKIISSALEKLVQDPAYTQDMIMYGPSLEPDYAETRMERLATARDLVTKAQMNTQPGPERIQAVKAATFARTHLPDLGLATTISYLNALK